MTRKTKRFLLTLASVTAGFFVVLFIGAAASGDLTPTTEQTEPAPQYRIEDHLTFIEFELDDGTPCVMVSSPSSRPVRLAGPSIPGRGGVSCNWGYTHD